MLRVGLTGGIGSGKSTVAGRLAEHGAVVIDSDRLAREVVEPGTEGLREVVAAFGTAVLAPDGALDRGKLAGLVFADDNARGRLNAIVHPRVGARTAKLMAGAAPDAIVVHDVPLLVENRLGPAYHLVVVVDAPVDMRTHRLVQQRGMAETDVRARIASQAGEAERRAAADVLLDNSGATDEVLAAVDALWADRLVRYESNVRLRRQASYGPPRLVEYDPTWPAQADRLAARIRYAVGDPAARVDHIGSTAVPGMAAKDLIGLQLTVSTLDDADSCATALTEAGMILRPDVDRDRQKGSAPDPDQWRKRFHGSADPGRPANLHIRVWDTAGWLFPLRFRDWLTAEESARVEYLSLKRDLARRFAVDDDPNGYAAAKEPWYDTVMSRLEEWAERTGWTPD